MLRTIRAAENKNSGSAFVSDAEADKTSLPGCLPSDIADGMGVRLSTRECREACFDLARSSGPAGGLYQALDGTAALKKSSLSLAGAQIKGWGNAVPLRDELPHAIRAYDYLVACVRRLMASAGRGILDTGSVAPAIEGLVMSLERNPDALLSLPKLRQRDAYVYSHCANVSILLAAYALRNGGDQIRVATYALAGLFHDLGKAMLPASLLNARRRLSPTEETLVSRHPMLACDLLANLPDLRSEVIMAALEHHERYDGSGYPKGLAGDAISEMGHLAGIADTYDAISSRRPYKRALFPHRTLGVMYRMRKIKFHPVLLEKFVRLVGIYPVGSVVELKDGYRGVVTGSNFANPMRPVVTLALDPGGQSMRHHECDLNTEHVAAISRCLPPELSGVDACNVLGLSY